MISPDEFRFVWGHLCQRFGRAEECWSSVAVAYHEYLSPQMSTGEFVQAARALWATAKFFPAPSEFLTIGALGDWRLLLRAAEAYRPPDPAWVEPWRAMSERGREALKRLGGIDVARRIWERDPLKLKAAWEQAFAEETAQAATQLDLLPEPRGALIGEAAVAVGAQ